MAREIQEVHPPRSGGGIDDVVILGGGLAGIFCALKLAPRPVTILTAAPIGEGASSAWAQGGMAAAVAEGDTPDKHLADTLAAGAGIVDRKIAALMTREARARVEDLLAYGVPFDKDVQGRLTVGREAAHSERRIVHVRGDMAGREIMAALIAEVRRTPSIRVMEGYVGEGIAMDGRQVQGVVARPSAGKALTTVLFPAHAVVLASGGIGHLYAVTTNPKEANGHGLAMAARAGAILADLEFVQFHPTAIDVGRDPAPLATEALRGDGAILVDRTGERFMPRYHPDGELAPRDIVARAIHAERAAGRGAFLDCRAAIGAGFADRYPTVYATCVSAGIDPVTQLIPVAPAAHYHMGGVLTDANGRTSLDGLWAAGEVASTGAHGANRLASNSLLEAVVFAARIAEDIQGLLPSPKVASWSIRRTEEEPELPWSQDTRAFERVRQIMATEVGVIREAHGLSAAIAELERIERATTVPWLKNAVLTARLVAAAAWARKESRGGHYRSDFPDPVPALARRSFTTLADLKRIGEESRRDLLPEAASA
ncbi:L-aspartate oxidase [Prosthecomicrobium sp. N25]|uniref:L-aspartate oxidase n=1 Tax=Prosthecomicrobium sp. N25 TaxID=3129254 RepID=UPI003077228E